jgi:predicted transcriptional regulator
MPEGVIAVDNPPSPVGGAELEVLKTLWEHGPGTVREVNARLTQQGRSWAYTTVQTMLQRLEAKGFVRSDKSGAAHVFAAVVSRDRLLSQRLRDLANQFCDGTASPLVLALVEGTQFTPEEIQQLRQLLDQLEAPEQGKKRPGKR